MGGPLGSTGPKGATGPKGVTGPIGDMPNLEELSSSIKQIQNVLRPIGASNPLSANIRNQYKDHHQDIWAKISNIVFDDTPVTEFFDKASRLKNIITNAQSQTIGDPDLPPKLVPFKMRELMV